MINGYGRLLFQQRCPSKYICIFIFTYLYAERERERVRKKERVCLLEHISGWSYKFRQTFFKLEGQVCKEKVLEFKELKFITAFVIFVKVHIFYFSSLPWLSNKVYNFKVTSQGLSVTKYIITKFICHKVYFT
jgi:hypothetical protein